MAESRRGLAVRVAMGVGEPGALEERRVGERLLDRTDEERPFLAAEDDRRVADVAREHEILRGDDERLAVGRRGRSGYR